MIQREIAKYILNGMKPSMAVDADKWITVHPHGEENPGTPVLIDDTTKEIKAGMGGKFNGRTLDDIGSSKQSQQIPSVWLRKFKVNPSGFVVFKDRSFSSESDKKTWVRKNANGTYTVNLSGKITPKYADELKAFLMQNGYEYEDVVKESKKQNGRMTITPRVDKEWIMRNEWNPKHVTEEDIKTAESISRQIHKPVDPKEIAFMRESEEEYGGKHIGETFKAPKGTIKITEFDSLEQPFSYDEINRPYRGDHKLLYAMREAVTYAQDSNEPLFIVRRHNSSLRSDDYDHCRLYLVVKINPLDDIRKPYVVFPSGAIYKAEYEDD